MVNYMETHKKRKVKRNCVVCGKAINVILLGKRYKNGHYFGKIKLPIKPGEYKKIGTTKIGKFKIGVVKWTGKHKKVEYWECNNCFKEAAHECWLEEKIEKLYGKKCKDHEPGCPTCNAWFLYKTVLEDNRGEL